METPTKTATNIEQLLAFFARKIIAKYRPVVIGITGSVGKTSARHAIAAALSTKYNLREPEKNFNNQVGIPLTIIGTHSIDEATNKITKQLGWLRIFVHALVVWLLPQKYPKMLVLEYGIDHPGDMDSLLDIVAPSIAVLTSIGESHLENYESQQQLANEKGKIASRLPAKGLLVYNADNNLVFEQAVKISAGQATIRKMAYGKNSVVGTTDVVLKAITENLQIHPSTTLEIQTSTRELTIKISAIGEAHIAAVLVAVALCEGLEVESDLIISGLANYKPMPGRLNIIAGIKRAILIDDTYNSAPASTIEALNLLARFPASSTKTAVLGDMLELGPASNDDHTKIGQLAAGMYSKGTLQTLTVVGPLGKIIGQAAMSAGMPESSVHFFENSDAAKNPVLENLQSDSVVLIKGSQGARMEKIAKELLAEPMSASHLLVRQYGKWVN